ncbi:non-ribosomal peptide synthetase [Microcoleus sp. FACHB-672]|uniref:non-ribosomal peptide synthetase n=1 Tax=Microcoleus sp. FACHB-672 TaxID=2692825 RepID=UPI0016828484|nr:non-ribosomal peptide synthetase [Microcoleus sp. FACHB-672]MBD2040238.1 amino acid adenylation domain-containing protein [Microcoleus sp. FACHB-672]
MSDLLARMAELSPEKRELLLRRLNHKKENVSPISIKPQARTSNVFPLSFSQQRLWFLDQLDPGNPTYNIPAAIRLAGKLNVGALEQSFNEVIKRHEVLRVTFATVDEQPVQIIHPPGNFKLSVLDLTTSPNQDFQIQSLIIEEVKRPFELAKEPLLRVSLLHLNDSEYVVILTMHHIIADGWSMGIFIEEIAALYQAFSSGKPSPLPELSIQYPDFATWQRKWLQGEVLEKQIAYWKKQLEGTLPVLELPAARPRSAVQTFQGAQESFVVPKKLTEALAELSRREGTTLFMTLLAAFKTLLYRYTGQTDILIGSPIANRNRAEVEKLIGFFVNTLVLRTGLVGNPTFRELLSRVREVALGAYAHQDLPFEKLVEELQPTRNMSHAPLFQVMFILQNSPMPSLELPGLTLHPLEVETSTAKFDLTLSMLNTKEGLDGVWEYNTDLFDAATIKRVTGHFQNLLEGIVANPEQQISKLPLLTERERNQLLVEWGNSTAQELWTEDYSGLCIHELFEAQVEKTPDAVVVVFEYQQLTYQELNQRANQLAYYLQTLGVKPEVLVGICVERSLEMLVGLLAILKAGGAYVPLDPTYPSERLALMLEDAQVPVLLTQKHLRESLPEHQAQVVCLDQYELHNFDNNSLKNLKFPSSNPSNLAYVIYTSGSTGRPKGVQIAHASVINFLRSMQNRLEVTEKEVFLAETSLSFDIAILELFLPLITGACVVLVSREVASNGTELLKILNSSGATFMQATPATWQMLLAAGWQESKNLKILCGGEALLQKLANQLLERGANVWNLYGPTETTIWSTISQVESNEQLVSIGRPIANTQIYILDSSLQPVPIGAVGELYIGGAGLSRGYLNRPDLTAERFIPNPFFKETEGEMEGEGEFYLTQTSDRLYKTGDLARYLPTGEIEYLGRIDHQVKIRGFRIELGEIESALSRHSSVREVVVTAREARPGEKFLVAYLVLKEQLVNEQSQSSNLKSSDLRNFLKEKLPDYMVPAAFVLLEALPLTPNGKVDRRALPAPDTAMGDLASTFISPRNPIEEVIAGIWSEVLHVDRVGIHDNFFELGGHSLLATQVISRLREALQIELPLRYLFESPTVAGLSERIIITTENLTETTLQAPPLLPVPRPKELPLSFAQQRLWFLDQLDPGTPAYNISAAVHLKGDLNAPALEKSFHEIINRHEVLRTSFATANGQPVQIIHPNFDFTLSILDLAERQNSTSKLQSFILEEAQQPFDLTRLPLLRVKLLKLETTEWVVVLTMHHIVSDGWSMGVFVQEFATLYKAFCAGNPSPLPALPIQYADYAMWQRKWLQRDVLEAKLNYWKQQLGTSLPVLKFPTVRTRTDVSTFRGASYSFQLSANLSKAINQVSRQENVTLFMTLLAAFQTLLYRYTNQDDLVVGTDIANRTQVETESLIGFFVNLLVLRTDLSGNPTFRELLKRVREVTLNAYAHQDLPFEKLVEALRPDRSSSHNPLFQVLFVLQNMPVPALELPGLTLTPLEIDSGTAKFDLALFMAETKSEIIGTFKYNSDLFDETTIAQISARFVTLLTSIVTQTDTRLNNLEIITEAEKQKQAMQEVKREKGNFSKFKTIKPKALSLPQGELIQTEFLKPGETFPLVIKPAVAEVDIIDWAKNNREFIETKLLQHGAILFRGFNEPLVSVFEQFALSLCPQLFGEYGDLPREGISGKVYGSTPYPADKAILFHNESSHLHRWPLKIWFFCVQPAQQGGETPIVDCRRVYQLLDPKLIEKFTQKQLVYVRNYTDGLDVSWQEFFRTTDKAVVEDYCRQAAIEFEWKENNGLRTKKIRPAVTKHPKTGEMVFFNQLPLHHVSCLDPAVRASLLSVFGEENLPRNVYYGDGTPIEDSVIEEIQAVYQEAAVTFPWQAGDILMLDNMLAAHSRNPFTGSRKIVVAMGEMFSEDNY